MKEKSTTKSVKIVNGKIKLLLTSVSLVLVSTINAQKTKYEQNITRKPNIVFILADDLGYGDVGFNGQTKIKTPILDQMAREGMVFKQHYAGSPVCGPSRASLMTGKHTGHSSVRENPRWTKSGNPVDLSSADVTVAKKLKEAGYRTGIVGKWGLAENLDEGTPNKQGFDYFYGFNKHKSAHHYYPEYLYENENLVKIEGNNTAKKIGRYSQDLFTEAALDFIAEESNNKAPFFLYLAYTIPHFELTIDSKEKTQYENLDWPLRKMKSGHYLNDLNGHVTYAAMVSKLDSYVGEILQSLKKHHIDENTLVVFTSDNGHEYDQLNDEFFNSNSIYRGRKRDLYEGGLRMPFVTRWPGKIKPGSVNNQPSAFWDFLPTACEIAAVDVPEGVDGISYYSQLLGEKSRTNKHDYLYWEFNEKKGPIQSILKDDWKLVYFVNDHYELYNIKNDPSEMKEVSQNNPKIVENLKSLLQNARTEHPEFPLVKKTILK